MSDAVPSEISSVATDSAVWRRRCLLLFLVALVLRGGFGIWRLTSSSDSDALEFPDEIQYWQMASSFHEGDGLRDELGFLATRMPLFPAALSLLTGLSHGVVIAKAIQWFVSALSVVLIAQVAASLFDRRVGLLAGLLVACDPFLLFFSSLLLTETAFICAMSALWWVAASMLAFRGQRFRSWCIFGVLGAICMYLRESSGGLILGAAIVIWLASASKWRAFVGAAMALGMIVLALVPWAARNHRVIGEWRWLTTRAGISLYDGVGPQATGASDLGDVKQMAAVQGLGEAEWNRFFLDASIESIKHEPGRVLSLVPVKLMRMWNPFPNADSYQSQSKRLLSAAWTIPTFGLAALGTVLLLLRPERCPRVWVLFLLLPASYLSALHGLFVGSVRYRLGAVPLLDILAAVAIVAIWDRRRRTTSQTEQRGARG